MEVEEVHKKCASLRFKVAPPRIPFIFHLRVLYFPSQFLCVSGFFFPALFSFRSHTIFDMQDNLANSERHDDDDDDNVIVAENETKSPTMRSVVNSYHENEPEIDDANTIKSQQNVGAMDATIGVPPLECDATVVSNLICDISNVQLSDEAVRDGHFENTAITAQPTSTPKATSKMANASKRCKKCNCICDKNGSDQSTQSRTVSANANCERYVGCADANDSVAVQPMTATT